VAPIRFGWRTLKCGVARPGASGWKGGLADALAGDEYAFAYQTIVDLAELHERDVPLALDDFGAGFSSFEYLTRLPVDFLKVDRSLTSQAADNPRARAVLAGLVDICAELGVETEAEYAGCREVGITRGQGFYRAHPMPSTDLIEWTMGRMSAGEVQRTS
jgi:EAL domain-containing protein (putative c-di-GMP-specific phosphodiesterase class I)